MTTLLVQGVRSGISQDFRLSYGRHHVGSFAPYLYMHNAPAGTFEFEVIRDSITIFTKQFTSLDIKSNLNTLDNYAHVFLPLIPDNPLKLESGLYTARINTSGYYPKATSFMGWIQQFEDLNNKTDYNITNDLSNPLAIRFKELEEGVLLGTSGNFY